LQVLGVSPTVISSVGTTLVNITGRGFDDAVCSRNRASVGGSLCGVVACTVNQLTVLCAAPFSNDSTTPASLPVFVRVFGPAGNVIDSSDNATTITVSPAGAAIDLSDPSQLSFPASGVKLALSTVGLDGRYPSPLGDAYVPLPTVWLIPPSAVTLNVTANNAPALLSVLNATFTSPTLECVNATFNASTASISCVLPYVAVGSYAVALAPVDGSAAWLVAPRVLNFSMTITSVRCWHAGRLAAGLASAASGASPGQWTGEPGNHCLTSLRTMPPSPLGLAVRRQHRWWYALDRSRRRLPVRRTVEPGGCAAAGACVNHLPQRPHPLRRAELQYHHDHLPHAPALRDGR
jgi:hypothetical protein